MDQTARYTFDPLPSGILVTAMEGFWSEQDAADYLQQLTFHADRQRRVRGALLILVDLTELMIQSPSVVARFDAMDRLLVHGDRDRVAIVVKSAMVKLQVARTTGMRNTRVFDSRDAAIVWLTG